MSALGGWGFGALGLVAVDWWLVLFFRSWDLGSFLHFSISDSAGCRGLGRQCSFKSLGVAGGFGSCDRQFPIMDLVAGDPDWMGRAWTFRISCGASAAAVDCAFHRRGVDRNSAAWAGLRCTGGDWLGGWPS